MRITIDLDRETMDALTDAAYKDRRPPRAHAEAILMFALGTWKGKSTPIPFETDEEISAEPIGEE